MLAKIALGNVRKSVRDYAVYFVTLTVSVAVFYAFNSITDQAGFLFEGGSMRVEVVAQLLQSVTLFLAVVVGLLMIYANQFLMRRRKQELGLYQVLGMRRGQVARIISLETLFVALGSLVVGFVVGALLSWVLVFVTAQMFGGTITHFHFAFSASAFGLTLACFGIVFLLMLLLNARSLSHKRLVELLGARRQNEVVHTRRTWLSVLMFVAGVAMVAVSYWRLITTGDGAFANTPESQSALMVTTLLMLAGTFLLFYGLGTAFLALAKRTKAYWRGLGMFTARQLSSRANTVSVSLTVIAIVLFLTFTMASVGMSMASLITGMAKDSIPYDADVLAYAPYAHEGEDIEDMLGEAGVDPGSLGQVNVVTPYLSTALSASMASTGTNQGGVDSGNADSLSALSAGGMSEATGVALPDSFEHTWYRSNALTTVKESDYNGMRRLLGEPEVSLGSDGYVVLCSLSGEAADFFNDVIAAGWAPQVAGRTLRPAEGAVVSGPSTSFNNSGATSTAGALVLPDDVVDDLVSGGSLTVWEQVLQVMYPAGADVAEYDQRVADAAEALDERTGEAFAGKNADDSDAPFRVETHTEVAKSMESSVGLISYLCLYMGLVLLVAVAAIMAVQQLSSASDSAPRYRTLYELGCEEKQLYRSLLKQTLVMFVLPLAVGLAHTYVAVSVIFTSLSEMLDLDVYGASAVPFALLLALYAVYFLVTYRVSRSIVRAQVHTERHDL